MTWHVQPTREALIALTAQNPFERFADGRPKVPDDLIERMKLVTTEEAWGTMRRHGYNLQFAGNWKETHPGKVTVGRAVTAATVVTAGVCVGRGVGTGYRTWGRGRGGRVKRHKTGSDYSIPCKAY
jgi:hypothetical protein